MSDVEAVDSGKLIVAPAHDITAVDKMDLEQYQAWLLSESINVVEFKGGDWDLVGSKDELLGVPFVIARIRFNANADGVVQFVSVCCYTKDKKVVFNDGSTGIFDQLSTYVAKNDRTTAISCPKGLRVSRYDYTNDDGVTSKASTYYIV
jgi:hypothetical protein